MRARLKKWHKSNEKYGGGMLPGTPKKMVRFLLAENACPIDRAVLLGEDSAM
jgi:hypothetical protein